MFEWCFVPYCDVVCDVVDACRCIFRPHSQHKSQVIVSHLIDIFCNKSLSFITGDVVSQVLLQGGVNSAQGELLLVMCLWCWCECLWMVLQCSETSHKSRINHTVNKNRQLFQYLVACFCLLGYELVWCCVGCDWFIDLLLHFRELIYFCLSGQPTTHTVNPQAVSTLPQNIRIISNMLRSSSQCFL